MAREVTERLVDDLTGETADETVRFGLDNRNYRIDLTKENADELREVIGHYVAVATPESSSVVARVSRRAQVSRAQHAAAGNGEAGVIRTWAQANGFEVSGRGRISREIRRAYEAAASGQ